MQYQFQYGAPGSHRHSGTFLFVVGHMRSYSSVLCHILGSHPEISGYAEAHQSYLGRNDLDRLARTVREQTGEVTLKRIVLDKVLHNHREIAPDILRRSDVRCLFLLRNAGDTIASILNMARTLEHTGDFSDPSRVVAYYAERLARIEEYVPYVSGRALFVESERLLDDTSRRTCAAHALARARGAACCRIPDVPPYRNPGPRRSLAAHSNRQNRRERR
jgi:hypothetical protein